MKKKNGVLGWLWSRVRRRVPALLVMTAANVGSALLGVAFALGTKEVINAAVGGVRTELLRAAGVQCCIILGMILCLTVYRWLHSWLNAQLDRDWKQTLSGRILRGDYAAVSEIHSGELLNRMNNDVRAVDDGLLDVLPGLASMVTRLVAVVAVLLAMEPIFTAVLAVLGLVVGISTGMARKRLRGLNKEVSAAEGRVSGFYQESFEKLALVQAMGVEQEVERRGNTLMAQRFGLQKKRWMIAVTANTCISVLGYASGFVALVWCAAGLLKGTMSFGELTAVTQLVSQLQTPFVGLSGVINKYIALTAACERLMELEAICGRGEQKEAEPSVECGKLLAIRAEDLSFSYGRDKVLENCEFSLPAGSFTVVTGPSGIGKSTVLKLLLGLFRANEGRMYLETDAGQVPISRELRSLFAYVPQGNLLFSGTLRDNLLLTKPDASEEEIRRAVYVSGMDGYLSQLPEGLETMLGENALGLSEGQAQRLSIARAVLADAPVLLLDECTSALDAATEETVLRRIRELPGKTCIAVTHRPAALQLADWQLSVEPGKITCRKLERRA